MLTILVLIAILNPMISGAFAVGKSFEMSDHDAGGNQSRSGANHMIKKRENPVFVPQKLVDYHNDVRNQEKGSNLIYLKWDDNLAKNAKKWIEKCIFDHPLHYVPYVLGQNLHFTSGTAKYKDYVDGARDWYNEKKNYDFETGHCSGICAHYTTMVKWDYTLMGCAVHECPLLKAFGDTYPDALYLSCEYYSPYKDWPEKPYIKGPKCNKCPETFDHCLRDLCYTMSYPIWNDTDIPAMTSFLRPPAIAIIVNSFLVLISI